MENLPDISSLSDEAKDASIMALWEEIQNLHQRLDALEKTGINKFDRIWERADCGGSICGQYR
ncbi:MAG: hypothetical protein F6K11_22695 [Leptolyngbya sp. SIO3F4]|nr:hypothetical protein [Leptolyngbya sp. SIO3F4]